MSTATQVSLNPRHLDPTMPGQNSCSEYYILLQIVESLSANAHLKNVTICDFQGADTCKRCTRQGTLFHGDS